MLPSRLALIALVAPAAVCMHWVTAAPAVASSFVQPPSSPVVVAVPPSGRVATLEVVASGFASGALVFVEQCDGVSPDQAQWSPTTHCDLGSSPSPAIADAHGVATFPATDRNHAFRPFVGESPQSLFNCNAPARPMPTNGLPDFSHCTLRVSTSNTVVTGDQSFLGVTFVAGTAAAPRAASAKNSTTTEGSRARTTTPTTVARQRAKSAGKSSSGGKSAPSSVVAVMSAPRPAPVGFTSISDASVATGYVLFLLGSMLVVLTVALRRRVPVARIVTDTQTLGER